MQKILKQIARNSHYLQKYFFAKCNEQKSKEIIVEFRKQNFLLFKLSKKIFSFVEAKKNTKNEQN